MTELLPLLQDFYREKLTMLLRHQAGARLVSQYDVNNTYQERFFEQALAGRTDLLGRRGEQLGPAHGEVLASRWIE